MRSPGFPLATPFQGTLKYSGAYVRLAGCLVDNCAIGAECGSALLPSHKRITASMIVSIKMAVLCIEKVKVFFYG